MGAGKFHLGACPKSANQRSVGRPARLVRKAGETPHAPVKMRPFHLARLGLDRRQLSEFFGSFRMGETGNFSSWWDLSGVTVQESFFSAFRQTPVAWSATMFFIEDKEVGSTLMV